MASHSARVSAVRLTVLRRAHSSPHVYSRTEAAGFRRLANSEICTFRASEVFSVFFVSIYAMYVIYVIYVIYVWNGGHSCPAPSRAGG